MYSGVCVCIVGCLVGWLVCRHTPSRYKNKMTVLLCSQNFQHANDDDEL